MRTSTNIPFYSILFLYLTTFATAWPLWPRWLPELDSLIVRQNQNGGSSTTPVAQQTQTTASPKETNSQTDAQTGKPTGSQTATGKPSGSASGSGMITGTGKPTGSNSTTTKTRSTSYDMSLPAGGIAMMTPAVIEGMQYYKVGDFVTFGWNYTNLEATPTAVNVMATCSANQQLYTISANMTVANNTGAVTWDTGSYQATAASNPLLSQTYTLIIYDAASSISATAQAGYLAVYQQYAFGMYTPQAYTPLGEFKCATCSGALGAEERRALGMLLGMACLTVASFTWFMGGLGVIW